jgi:Uma2 family endonuclease
MLSRDQMGFGMTSQPRQVRLSAEAFVDWAVEQSTGRYELLRGEVVGMAPERVAHARVKKAVVKAFDAGIAAAGLDCEAFADGMAVRIDDSTVYEPDAMIRCGPKVPNDVVLLDDAVVVVEVASPSSGGIDAGTKLADYFRLPSVRHYLLVQPETRRVIHHERAEAGEIATRILQEGTALALDPPGIEVGTADFFSSL